MLTEANCASLKADGAVFVGRYLPCLGASEFATILDSGLLLLPIGGYARAGGWGQGTGHDDAMQWVARAQRLGIPESVHVVADNEGQGGTVEDWLAYISTSANVRVAAGYQAIEYEGAGVPLSGAQWYSIGGVTGYWESCSVVPRVGTCGPMIQQWHVFNQRRADGLEVDYDFVAPDAKGRLPVMVGA
jgi:hypothetical protein